MRTSGKESDLPVLVIPLTVLILVGLFLTTDGGEFCPTVERQLWNVVNTVGRWVSGLFS